MAEKVTNTSTIVRLGNERVYGPNNTGASQLLYGPYQDVPVEIADRLGLLTGEHPDGVWVEQLDPDPEQLQGQRDSIAAQRLYDMENSSDVDKAQRESELLAGAGHGSVPYEKKTRTVPDDADIAHARNAQDLEDLMVKHDADTAAELAPVVLGAEREGDASTAPTQPGGPDEDQGADVRERSGDTTAPRTAKRDAPKRTSTGK